MSLNTRTVFSNSCYLELPRAKRELPRFFAVSISVLIIIIATSFYVLLVRGRGRGTA